MRVIQPNIELEPYVESIWYTARECKGEYIRKLMPDGSCEIIINLGDPYKISYDNHNYQKFDSINLVFIRDTISYLIEGKQSTAIGIRLKPFALYLLIGKSINEFETKIISLGTLLPQMNVNLLRCLENDKDTINSIQNVLIEEFLNNQQRRHFVGEEIYKEIELKKGMVPLHSLMSSFELNYKFCERLFLKYYGITPKKYIRHRRLFFTMVELMQKNKKPDFMSIVAKYGFHDQAHLIKEYNYLTGGSPLIAFDDIINCKRLYRNHEYV